jgi:hypothetical protein
LRVARKLKKRVFQRRGVKLIGIDAKACVHRYDSDGWRSLQAGPEKEGCSRSRVRLYQRDPCCNASSREPSVS